MIFANNHVFLALLVIISISHCECNEIFGTPEEKHLSKPIQYASKYLFVFPEAYYLLNSQSYEALKLYSPVTPYLSTKKSKFTQQSQFVPLCVPPGEKHFDSGDLHLWNLFLKNISESSFNMIEI